MYCWKCHQKLPQQSEPLSFRAVCDCCGVWLHTCKGCRYYSEGKPNDCLIPGTESIADREANNYCDDFKTCLTKEKQKPSPSDISKKLFGEEPPENQDFDSLFK